MPNTQDAKLVTGDVIGQAPYVALSYCWGLVPQLTLLPDNYLAFKSRISFESLSKVAQDAATLCRALSVCYLWTDAMCIIQGPDDDFQQEALQMENIYTNALFTITAAVSKDTSQPFLIPRGPLSWVDYHLREYNSGQYRGLIEGNIYCSPLEQVPGTFPLDCRSWCFQEQFLSPRSIYFGARGVHWDCRTCISCEHEINMTRPYCEYDDMIPSRKGMYLKLVSLGQDRSEPETSYGLRQLWRRVVREYSMTQSTYKSDRLVALAGVVSLFEGKFGMQASFGLWSEFFLDGLLWFVYTRTIMQYSHAPSWAWVNAHDAEIHGADTLHSGERNYWQCLITSFSATVEFPPRITGPLPLGNSLGHDMGNNVYSRGYITRCIHHDGGLLTYGYLDQYCGGDTDGYQNFGRYYADTNND